MCNPALIRLHPTTKILDRCSKVPAVIMIISTPMIYINMKRVSFSTIRRFLPFSYSLLFSPINNKTRRPSSSSPMELLLHQHLTKHPLFFHFLLLTLCLLRTSTLVLSQGTITRFYSRSCPNAESIVRDVVESHFQSDNTIAGGILRMHFHDCFVRGCDASVLIDGPSSERTAGPNLSLRGFDVIDDAKSQLESVCPGVVSCADILALAARDSVDLSGGPSWQVPTGRRDGLVSSASDANNLPSFTDSVDVQKQKFSQFGLTTKEMVTLLGGHTIGTTQCQFFSYRLYNFTSSGGPDPSMDPDFVQRMRLLCPLGGDGSRRVALDTDSQFDFDTSYYSNLRDGQGVLESDQKLWTDASTSRFVSGYTGLLSGILGVFRSDFARAMVKMSNIGVSTGTVGEIRRVCSAFN